MLPSFNPVRAFANPLLNADPEAPPAPDDEQAVRQPLLRRCDPSSPAARAERGAPAALGAALSQAGAFVYETVTGRDLAQQRRAADIRRQNQDALAARLALALASNDISLDAWDEFGQRCAADAGAGRLDAQAILRAPGLERACETLLARAAWQPLRLVIEAASSGKVDEGRWTITRRYPPRILAPTGLALPTLLEPLPMRSDCFVITCAGEGQGEVATRPCYDVVGLTETAAVRATIRPSKSAFGSTPDIHCMSVSWTYASASESGWGMYCGDSRSGPWVECSQDGARAEGLYRAGKRDGDWRLTDRHGAVSHVSYERGQPAVPSTASLPQRASGGAFAIGEYLRGERHGAWEEGDGNGGLWRGHYEAGTRHGRFTWILPRGHRRCGDVLEGIFLRGEMVFGSLKKVDHEVLPWEDLTLLAADL